MITPRFTSRSHLSQISKIAATAIILLLGSIIIKENVISNNNQHNPAAVNNHDDHQLTPTHHHHRRLGGQDPGVAWLMSFPNSGTSFTQLLIMATTQKTVASFYGHEFFSSTSDGMTAHHNDESIPIFPYRPDGPFRLSDLPIPSDGGFVLSKTHCGGYCFSDCPPHWFTLTPQQFLKECTTGARFQKPMASSSGAAPDAAVERVWIRYDPAMVQKAIHLVRDPYDNVISRFHHEYNLQARADQSHVKWKTSYSNDAKGFRQWCEDADAKYRGESRWLFDADTIDAFNGVPCHFEFFRYVQWHNNAFAVRKNMQIPAIFVHYKDYDEDLEGTINKMLEFLGLERVEDKDLALPGFGLMTYKEEGYFSSDDRKKIRKLIKFLAVSDTWEILEEYLSE